MEQKKATKRNRKTVRKRSSNTDVTRTLMTENNDDGTQTEQNGKEKKGKNANKAPSKTPLEETENYKKQMKDFVQFCTSTTVMEIAREFTATRAECTPGPKTAFEANHDKNRYKDVYCLDESRVKLEAPQDYIHANYLDYSGFKRKYICTQAPMKKTIGDFWRLIWQEKTPIMVMLCGILEQGKPKCEQYWPEKDGETVTYDGITITTKKIAKLEEQLTQTVIECKKEGQEPHLLTHFYWHGWPDRGVPKEPMSVLRLLTKFSKRTNIVVHCSAGIGRTGTIIGLGYAQKVLAQGEKMRLKDVVKEMRRTRYNSVQTDVQYVFMHYVLLSLAENRGLATPDETATFRDDYNKFMTENG